MWVVLVLISAVLFAVANIVRKFVLTKEHPLEFLAARGFFTIIVLFFLIPWVDMSIDFRVLGLIYLSSLVATIGYYYQTKAQRHTDISALSPLQNFSPLILIVFAYLFLGETITIVQFLGILAIVAGSYILTTHRIHPLLVPLSSIKRQYWLPVIFSVVILAVAAALDKFLLGFTHPATYLFFGWLFMNINYIMIDWWLYDWKHLIVDFRKGWFWLLLAAATSVASFLLFYEAISAPAVLVTLALPLKRVSTLIETLFGGTLFHEKNLPRKLFACLIMLVGVVLVAK